VIQQPNLGQESCYDVTAPMSSRFNAYVRPSASLPPIF
jgi:hypothetical protein